MIREPWIALLPTRRILARRPGLPLERFPFHRGWIVILVALVTVVAFVLLLLVLHDQREIHHGFRALALWDRLLWGPMPSPDELNRLVGGAVELLDTAREDAARVAHVPVTLARTLQDVNLCLVQIEGYLGDWRLRLLRCAAPPSVPHLATPRLRMRRIRFLGPIEYGLRAVLRLPLGTSILVWSEKRQVWTTVTRSEALPGTEIHIAFLRAALRLARHALDTAPHVAPEHLPARIDAVRNDIEVLLRDCVETHTQLWRAFTRWRDALDEPGGAH